MSLLDFFEDAAEGRMSASLFSSAFRSFAGVFRLGVFEEAVKKSQQWRLGWLLSKPFESLEFALGLLLVFVGLDGPATYV